MPHLPDSGETIRATSFKKGFGGKGANQVSLIDANTIFLKSNNQSIYRLTHSKCVAAAKLGSKTVLISKVSFYFGFYFCTG